MRALFVLAVCVALGPACRFDAAVGPDVLIECSSSGDCPDHLRCAGLIERCVPVDGDDRPPGAAGTFSAHLLPADGSVEITVVPDEALAFSPVVQVGDVERTASAAGSAFVARYEAAELGGGLHPAFALLIDASGNPGVAALGAVEVDDVPPALDTARPLHFRIVPPPGALVAAPTRVTPGSVVEVAFDVTEPLKATPTVAARGAEVRSFDLGGEREGALLFSLIVEEPLAAGSYEVTADLEDVAGNTARVTLPLPPPFFVVEAVVPSPCVAVDGDGTAVCTDFDGDGAPGRSDTCPEPVPFDCDDVDPLVYPAALELPGDGKDNDCAGDGDLALDESTTVFADPTAPPGGDGSRAAPFADLLAATEVARPAGKALGLRAGTFTVSAGWFTSTHVIGGLDDRWSIDPTARTRVELVTGNNNTVFPTDTPHAYLGLELVSPTSLVDAATPLTLARCVLDAANGAAFAPELTLVDVEVRGGFITVDGPVRAVGSRLLTVAARSGLVLRSRLGREIAMNGPGELTVVSSSIRSVGGTPAALVTGGVLAFYGSTIRAVRADALDEGVPAVRLVDGELRVVGSAWEAGSRLVELVAGTVHVVDSAVVAACAIGTGDSCLLAASAPDCAAASGCSNWEGVIALVALPEAATDPHLLDEPALAGAGPALLPRGAPSSVAGDLVGRCRDTRAPALGANEPLGE